MISVDFESFSMFPRKRLPWLTKELSEFSQTEQSARLLRRKRQHNLHIQARTQSILCCCSRFPSRHTIHLVANGKDYWRNWRKGPQYMYMKKALAYAFAIVRATHPKAFWCCPSRLLFKGIAAVLTFVTSCTRPRAHIKRDRLD